MSNRTYDNCQKDQYFLIYKGRKAQNQGGGERLVKYDIQIASKEAETNLWSKVVYKGCKSSKTKSSQKNSIRK